MIPFKIAWLQFSPGVAIDMGMLLDPISVMMIVIVTFISLMVHFYSLGYMKGEERCATYYSFLGLFTFSMLGLVLSSNIFQIYIFWELVGVSSFLLIGYYFDKPSAVAASKKAFIVTRFADLGFLIGILVLAICTAAITAFYMFRLYFSIFWNKEYHAQTASHDEHTGHDAHHSEGPLTMMMPLILLGLLSIVAGFVPFSHLVTSDGAALATEFHITFSIAPVLLATGGIFLALAFYKKENAAPQKLADGIKGFYTAAYHKFYIDEIYLFITKKVVFNLIGRPAAWFDKNIVDGTMNLLATVTEKISFAIKKMQSGKTQSYAAYFFAGVIGFILIFVYLWT